MSLASSETPTLCGERLSFDNRFAVVDSAKADGWNLRGSGAFSRVLVKDDQALKIFFDDAYLQYITSDLVKRGSEATPRLLSPVIYGDRLNAVFLEALVHWSFTEEVSNIVFGLDMVAEDIFDYGLDVAIKSFQSSDFQSAHDWLKPSGVTFFIELLKFIDKTKFRPDISSTNLMMRKSTGQAVFSDPVAQPVSHLLTFFTKEDR